MIVFKSTTDQSFGLFKSLFCKNLKKLTNNRLTRNLSVFFRLSLTGLLVFGGKGHKTKIADYKDAYALSFSPEKNQAAWAAVGAAPLTQSCLRSREVIHDTAADPRYIRHKKAKTQNHIACKLLSARGYAGRFLKVDLNTVQVPRSITVPNSKAGQEAIESAKHQGNRFHATRGRHLCSDDIFIAMELKKHRGERFLFCC